MSNIDRLMMYGNATDPGGHTIGWNLEGLAATYKGTVILELNGGTSSETNSATSSDRIEGFGLTYIATIS